MINKTLYLLLISTIGFSQLTLKVPGAKVEISPSSIFTDISELKKEIEEANKSLNSKKILSAFRQESLLFRVYSGTTLEFSVSNDLCFKITNESTIELLEDKALITNFIIEPKPELVNEKLVIKVVNGNLILEYEEHDYSISNEDFNVPICKDVSIIFKESDFQFNRTNEFLLKSSCFKNALSDKLAKYYQSKDDDNFLIDIIGSDRPNEIIERVFIIDTALYSKPNPTYKEGEIRKENYWNQFIVEYYNESYKNHYKGIPRNSLQGLNSLMDSLNKYLKKDLFGNILQDTLKDCGCGNLELLSKNSFIFSAADQLWELVSASNRDWVRDWLWLTNGEPTLNPLRITESLADSIPIVTRRLGDNEKLIELIQNAVKSNTPLTSNISDDYKETIKKISEDKLYLDYLNKLGNNEFASDELLYEFEFPKISWDSILFWYDHYDASKSFEFINSNSKPKKFREPFSIYTKDENIVAVHNIPNTMVVDLNATEEKVEVPSRVESEFTVPLANAVISNNLIGGGLGTGSGNSHGSKSSGPPVTNNCDGFYKPDSTTFDCKSISIDSFKVLISIYQETVKVLSWLNQQTVPTPSLKLIKDTTPAFKTQYLYPERKLKLESDREISYNLITNAKKDSLVASKKYIKYNKVHFLPFAGLAYLPIQRVNVDYIDDKLVNTEEFNNAIDFYAGVKWYPWGINRSWDYKTSKYLRKKFEKKYCVLNSVRGRGNLALERLSFSLGLGANQEFLNNYFLGFGWDPVPGLNLQIGSNLYFQRTLEFKNGIEVNKGHNAKLIGPYYALTVDLGIANNLISIFKR